MSIEFNRETHENKNRKDIIGIHDNEIANHNLDIDACLRLGDALHKQERYEEAVAVYDRALAAHTDCGALYYNKGNALLELQRWEEAVRVYFRAVSLIPAFAEGYVTIATALQALRRPYEAMASCYRALAIDPCCAEAHWNLALALLQVGEYAKGWEEFEWRWKKRGYTSKQRQFPQPAWAGEPLSGRTILIHAEQALGDTVQFARFLPLVAECGGRVILECPAPLKGLMAGMDGVQQAYATGEKLPHFDLHLPLMSLPKILRTTIEALPVDVPYLAPGLEHVAEWAGKFNTHDELRAGIVWAGRKKPDPNRTCPLEQFIPLAQVPGVKFYSLQIGEKGEGDDAVAERLGLADLTSAINDFRDTAAFIAQLDLVISIDTSVAHLAGAMGRETWTLLPHAADWRWMLDRDDSPWYPNMRLFRQERPGDWQGVMVRIGTALMEKSRDTAATLTLPSPELEAHYVDATDSLRRDDLKEAEKSLQKALLLNCRIPEIYNGLGILAESTRKRKTALAFLHKAISSDHDYPDAHINLGNILFKENRIDEAVAEYLRAIEISPGNVMALQNLGVAFQSQGRLREAAECFRKALEINPGYSTARWNLAALMLLSGDYTKGFREFEARFAKNDPVPVLHGERPCWDGSPFPGKTLLVHAEQGFGDTFQFVRYLPLVAERGDRVLFECQDKSLREILKSVVADGDLFVRGDKIPVFDLQVPLLSLPRIFGTTKASIPSAVPYLRPMAEKAEAWKKRVENDRGLRTGIVWSGRPKPDPKRSASLALLAPLAAVPGTIFYSLQVGEGAEQASFPPDGMILRDYSGKLVDFTETAALIANLDLVITIDSAVAHLAGAMGKPVWVLLPHAPDWRWMLGRNDSPWYPTMRLFRQRRAGDWSEPVMEMRLALNEFRKIIGD